MTKSPSYMQRVINKVRREGAVNSIMQVLLRLESKWFDVRYAVDTHGNIKLSDLNIASGNVEHGRQYQPILISHLRQILEKLNPSSDDVLVDFGSGKGRVLLYSSRYAFRKVVGVEFSEELCEIAEANTKTFRAARRCPIEIHCIDAGKYRISPEETVFYFFNPFDKVVMQTVIDNIRRSVIEHPRRVRIVYHNLKAQSLAGDSDFAMVTDAVVNGMPFQIYEAGPARTAASRTEALLSERKSLTV